ncbi:MAG TPA: hypothetical protein VN628_02030 [Vicinamibacterales bacterium]|nr:hypothetical protein [Vicinamibacterales bacterium]
MTARAERRAPDVVARASRYVETFIQNFSNVVAEERYVQESAYPHRRRELLSEFLLVTAPGTAGRYQFRDVLEVDGAAVRDRGDRLSKLFVDAPADALERARAVAQESERYNLGNIGTLDQPLLAVGFLQPRYVNRFVFTPGDAETYDGCRARYVGFRESSRPTIIRTTGTHADFAAHGYFLIDEATGRVLRSEVDLGDGLPPPSIVTTFRFDADLGMMVPVEMRDPLGVATYGKFRRFSVSSSVVSALAVPK